MFWCKKVKTSCALAFATKDSYLLQRDTVWGCVQWKIACCMLFILDIIISFTQITGRGGGGVSCCGLKAKKGVDTQSKGKGKGKGKGYTAISASEGS